MDSWIVSLSNNNNDDITAQAVQYRNIPYLNVDRQAQGGIRESAGGC